MSEVMIRPVRTEQDYRAALKEIGRLMTARPGTPEGDELDVLSTLVEAYESEHQSIDAPDPIALIEFAIEQRAMVRADLAPILGSRARVSEILSRTRPLTLAMIRRLQADLGLPAEVLVREYPLRTPRRAAPGSLTGRKKLASAA